MAESVIDKGDTAWVMVCACFVFLMCPALGFFYAGLARAKNALSLMYLCLISVGVVSIQWYLIGYSLTFSATGGPFIGDSSLFLFRNVGAAPLLPSHTIPSSAFFCFQAMFACITPALAFGSAAERMSLGPAIIFIFVWTTLVYDVVTCWTWGPNGWLALMGVMDFAGGITVHCSSGLAAVAYAMVLGKRRDYDENVNTPHNVSFVFLGLALMWFGWFAFNAGSAFAANARSVNSLVCTHLAGCVGGVVWVLMDYRHARKWSIIGLCTGAVAGLATVTPGSGFVSPSSALAFGFFGSSICNIALNYKHKYRFDDALDVFAVHYIGGLVGLVLTGVFAQQSVIALGYPEGTPVENMQKGGWLDGNWMQVPIQLLGIVAVSAWSFVITYIILLVINMIPKMKLRLDDEAELMGTDWAEMGERAYAYLPFEEQQTPTRQSRSSDDTNENNNDQSNDTSSSIIKHDPYIQHHENIKKHNPFKGIKKLMMTNDRTVIKGVPDLIEEPVMLDYHQQKDLGAIRMHEIVEPTGGDLYQKTQAKLRDERQAEEDVIEVIGHSMLRTSTTATSSCTNVSSTQQTTTKSSSSSSSSSSTAASPSPAEAPIEMKQKSKV
ncbi:ammonium transporter AmtB-like domain-containing protein [Halteromyces radiatus]|uniref:ammonium transporter AmtB-like domain-containing protein n=1 Tax=Halteromyces radiatus TaxID=101107 RepID=UPI00221E7743|nr:ammonium transporter AmtB-like domain-containing protein [Halteromyces radiatus]KAI8096247.1 ammonium transporter AmtB-like domain-containing protein [Halteromyces radiatus]